VRVGTRENVTNVWGGLVPSSQTMEQHAVNNENNCLNTNIYSCLETSGGQSSNLYFNFVYFFNDSVNKTSVAV